MKFIEAFRAVEQRTRRRRQVWETVPQTSKLILFGMIFCLFAGIGALGQLQSPAASSLKLWAMALVTGIFAMGYAWVAFEKSLLLMVPLVGLQGLVSWGVLAYISRHSAPGPSIPETIRSWLDNGITMATLLIGGAYAMAMSFIYREGDRFFHTHTEMKLAGEIHKSLVPTIQLQSGKYEFYGASQASGTVGGDLVDVIERDGHWLAYVAGHGVSSGVLMAMIKSATSMSAHFDPAGDDLLGGLNQLLCALKTGNIFATFGLLTYSSERGLRYSLAGHLPILLGRGVEIRFLPAQNMPVGVFSTTVFESTGIDALTGDVFAVITDGLTEVFDRQERELGIDAIAAVLRKEKTRPLSEIAAAIFEQARRHGPRSDDQSLLLVRKVG